MAGDVTFQTPHDLGSVQSFVSTTGHVDAGLLMAGHAGEDDPVEGGVGLTVTSPGSTGIESHFLTRRGGVSLHIDAPRIVLS